MKNAVFTAVVLYLLISCTQIFINKKQEFFPIYSFKLYSKVPQEIKTKDLKIKMADGKAEHFLLTGSLNLDKIERKYWRTRINFSDADLNASETQLLNQILTRELGFIPQIQSIETIDIFDKRFSSIAE